MHACRSNGATSIVSRPASIFVMSSTSSTSDLSTEIECRKRPTSSTCCVERAVVLSRSTTPTMPLRGVRISWLMFAKNDVLARFASTAFDRASWILWRRVDTYSGRTTSAISSPTPADRCACQYDTKERTATYPIRLSAWLAKRYRRPYRKPFPNATKRNTPIIEKPYSPAMHMYQVAPPLSASMPTRRRGMFSDGQTQIAANRAIATRKNPERTMMMVQSNALQALGGP